ncbi:MAG: hypothetical protein WA705_28960 [Candidatus Ozemobacteraceae bacterium]
MKVENNAQPKSGRRMGVTFVEMTLAICIVVFLAGIIYHVFDRQVSQAGGDERASKYYLGLGIFAESLNNDLAMARDIQPASNGLTLQVNPDGIPESVTYTRRGNKIERNFRGVSKYFEFNNPNRKETPLIFRVEEGSL